MTLFGTIQTANTGLQASQIGLQVVGNNVANANTPGYIRQRMGLTTNPTVRHGGLLLGQGVRATGVTQMVDQALMERMFAAGSDKAGGKMLDEAYTNLEQLIGSLDDSGLGAMLGNFNAALHELSVTPNDASLREFVVLQGDMLAREIRRTQQSVASHRNQLGQQISSAADAINEKAAGIASLNVVIAGAEGGGLLGSDAAGAREKRNSLVEELSELVDITIQEQASGSVSVFIGGDYLVIDGEYREVAKATHSATGDLELRIKQIDAPLQAKGGRYGGMLRARGEVYDHYLSQLDTLAAGLIEVVNTVHTQGQGRRGFSELAGTARPTSGVPLKEAGLDPPPRHGAFEIQMMDTQGDLLGIHQVAVRQLGQVGDSTVDSVVADIDAIDGLTARLGAGGQVVIESSQPGVSFAMANDSSGFLAAAGLNTFFVGSGAHDIDVNSRLKADSDLLAVSFGGVGQDTDALLALVDLVDIPMDSLGGRSIRGTFDNAVARLGQQMSLQRSLTRGAEELHNTLHGEHLGITGVSLDEESLTMLALNRSFQANARVISTVNEMLDVLLRM